MLYFIKITINIIKKCNNRKIRYRNTKNIVLFLLKPIDIYYRYSRIADCLFINFK